MTPDQLRILAGIKPIPSKKDLPPPVMKPVTLEVNPADIRRAAGAKPLMEEPVAPVVKPETKVTEAYADAGEMESDLDAVRNHIKAAKRIIESSSMRKHIKDTHENYGTQTQSHANVIVKALEMAEHNVDAFYEKLVAASS